MWLFFEENCQISGIVPRAGVSKIPPSNVVPRIYPEAWANPKYHPPTLYPRGDLSRSAGESRSGMWWQKKSLIVDIQKKQNLHQNDWIIDIGRKIYVGCPQKYHISINTIGKNHKILSRVSAKYHISINTIGKKYKNEVFFFRGYPALHIYFFSWFGLKKTVYRFKKDLW